MAKRPFKKSRETPEEQGIEPERPEGVRFVELEYTPADAREARDAPPRGTSGIGPPPEPVEPELPELPADPEAAREPAPEALPDEAEPAPETAPGAGEPEPWFKGKPAGQDAEPTMQTLAVEGPPPDAPGAPEQRKGKWGSLPSLPWIGKKPAEPASAPAPGPEKEKRRLGLPVPKLSLRRRRDTIQSPAPGAAQPSDATLAHASDNAPPEPAPPPLPAKQPAGKTKRVVVIRADDDTIRDRVDRILAAHRSPAGSVVREAEPLLERREDLPGKPGSSKRKHFVEGSGDNLRG